MKMVVVVFMFTFIFVLSGCQTNKNYPTFEGRIINVEESYIIVEPFEDEEIRRSGSEVSIRVEDDLNFQVGDEVRVTHDGPIMESFPLQINLIEIERTK
ncbi:DUF3221 domain-containing protein [Alkalibacterium sp. 20]|uniref:DUF3221 domain-containing protein n=1 Tax=Alkalibacterium sp. 20 TaxID=1798803 RepID=UPI000900397F|nr:DUF3221 domain-containing protein [Alkalibacterium sp. 20]OJF93087.1 hypothetical protein AX762_02420 [Alkalibacterium sp. 20]